MKNSLFRFLALSIVMLGLATSAQAELNLDFELVNKTGYGIKEIYIAPSASDNWEENILKSELENGETLEVSFSPEANSKKWDLKIVWSDGDTPVVWSGYDLTEISKLTLFYNADTEKTTAKAE